MHILIWLVVWWLGYVKQNRNNDNDKLQLYNVLQKRLISQKYKKKFSWKIRLVAIPCDFYTLDFNNV